MNRIFASIAALTSALSLSMILIAATSIPALADPGDRVDNRLDNKGDRIERRFDRRASVAENRTGVRSAHGLYPLLNR